MRSYSAAYSGVPEHRSRGQASCALQPGDDDVQVRSEIKLPGGAPPVTVDYGMDKNDADWKVYDVIVDGVSLVTTYRSTFAEEIRQSGIDGLIKSLREKNAPPPRAGARSRSSADGRAPVIELCGRPLSRARVR